MREVSHMSEDVKDEETMEESVVLLVDEEGKEHEFQLVDMLEVEGSQYAVLSPIEDGEESEEAIILKVGLDSNGEEMLFDIEDDEEWEKVVEVWNNSLEEE